LSYNLDPQNAGAAVTEWFARFRGTAATCNDYRLTFAIAALFTVSAALIRTWGTAYLNAEVMLAMRVQTARLVADGPYRYVRNPLYFGNILWAIGFGFMASRIGFFILVLGMTVFCYRLILREEAGIDATQGESYRIIARRFHGSCRHCVQSCHQQEVYPTGRTVCAAKPSYGLWRLLKLRSLSL
jgi:protein-S-isoprenylcysteine O-methyltransferase Ste14